MALIDVRCAAGHESEVERPAREWPATPACPHCSLPTEQFHPPPRNPSQAEPVILFKGPDGQVRFVGDAHGVSAADYRRQGFEEIRLQGVGDVRRFEKHMNRHEYSRACRRAERAQQMREMRESVNRSELRARMQSMSRAGRDLARLAMAHNDAKPREYGKDPGFHSDVYSNDRSNRDQSRDAQGRRRRD